MIEMSWLSVIKQTAIVGRMATNANLWLQRKGTKQNIGNVFTSKPQNLSSIPIQVPQEKFEEYYNFLAEFYADGRWFELSQGSLQQGITNKIVENVLKDFERGKYTQRRKYSDKLDEGTEAMFQKTIKMMKLTSELLMTGSRKRIREGRNMLRYANDLEQSFDRGR